MYHQRNLISCFYSRAQALSKTEHIVGIRIGTRHEEVTFLSSVIRWSCPGWRGKDDKSIFSAKSTIMWTYSVEVLVALSLCKFMSSISDFASLRCFVNAAPRSCPAIPSAVEEIAFSLQIYWDFIRIPSSSRTQSSIHRNTSLQNATANLFSPFLLFFE